MRATALALLLGLAAALASPRAAAAEDPVVLEMQVDPPQQVTVGDRVSYQITLEADRGTNVVVLQGSLPAEVEIASPPRTTSRPGEGGRVLLTISFEMAPFVPGELNLPPMVLRYAVPDGSSGQIETPPSKIVVTSVLPAGGGVAPRDLKPQAEIGSPGPGWIAPAAGSAALALAVIVGLLLWRQRLLRSRAAVVPAQPAVVVASTEDQARAVLDQTGARFGADADYVAYYGAIAVTVRNYLTERYGFAAFALTTRELQSEMLRRGLDRWQVRVAGGLLSQCDSVVYAHYRPAAERADADLTAAYEIVEMSRPAEPHEVPVA